MSLHLQAGYFFTTNEVLAASSLNSLLGDAVATGLVSSNLATGYLLIDTQATAPGATLGYPWLDFTHTLSITHGPALVFGDGVTFTFPEGILALTYTGTIPTISAGRIVTLAPTDRVVLCGSYSSANSDGRVLGVCLTPTLNTGERGLFMYRGIGPVRIDALSLDPAYVGQRLEGSYIYARGTVSPGNGVVVAAPSPNFGENYGLFAVLLDSFTSATFTTGVYLAKILK